MYKGHRIVVTMTSWTKRINNCVPVLKSLLQNTVKPDIIYLNLSTTEFPGREFSLPIELINFIQSNPKVTLNWVGENTKTMKKAFPIFEYLRDDDLIINTDDDRLFDKRVIETWCNDYIKHGGKCAITNCGLKARGFTMMSGIWGNILYTKDMMKDYELFLTQEIVQTYNDDRLYQSLCYLNGYNTVGASDFQSCAGMTKHKLKSNFNPVQGMTANNGYSKTFEFDKIFRPVAERIYGDKFDRLFGIVKKANMRNIVMAKRNLDTNIRYIDYWKGFYNIGDVFSDMLFDMVYDKGKLDQVKGRKIIRFIGSEIPTKGWMNKNTLCCGMGWRVEKAKLDVNSVQPENFCYTRGKISRQRVIDSGVKIPKDLPIGDTGLLASLIYKPSIEKKYDIGILTHHSGVKNHAQYLKIAKELYPNKTIRVLSMSDTSLTVSDMFDFICSCKVIVASSLHAIIFSHSFGIPALFFSDVDSYKFKDYFSVYDRIRYDFSNNTKFQLTIKLVDDVSFLNSVNPTNDEVSKIQRNILSALPYKNCFTQFGNNLISDMYVARDCYLMQSKDNDILKNSSSGGIIPELVDLIMSRGGHVFGVAFTNDFSKLQYVEVTNENKFQVMGSKYLDVQISEDILSKIGGLLLDGQEVLFIGRPCQCKMLRLKFKEFPNLILIDLLCHGVPQDFLWDNYLKKLVSEYGEVLEVKFRDKPNGWKDFHFTIRFKSGKVLSQSFKVNEYMKDFLSDKYLKTPCKWCRLGVTMNSMSDITCGDAWGANTLTTIDNKGLSIVVSYSDKGKELLSYIQDKVTSINVTLFDLIKLKNVNRGLRI